MKRTGVRLRAFAARWFDAAAMERFIDPVLADMQAEYEEAIGKGRHWRGRWIWMAGHVGLAKVALWCEGRRLLHRVSGATARRRRPDPHPAGPAVRQPPVLSSGPWP